MKTININVFIDRENKSSIMELSGNSIVSDLLAKLKLNPVTVIVSRNNGLVLEDEKLNDGDDVKILSVISGG